MLVGTTSSGLVLLRFDAMLLRPLCHFFRVPPSFPAEYKKDFAHELLYFQFGLFFSSGIPPQHAPLGPPSSYYGGQEPHHKYHENGHHPPHHENFSDFVTLVCQETAQHQAAHHPQAHQAAAHHLRSPYAGYAPPLPPVSSSATASHRAIGRTHGK